MHPVLFTIGGLTIHTYGFFVALGFFFGILLAKSQAQKAGIDPDKIMDLSFFVLLAAIIGARLFYVLTVPEVFIADPVEILRIWNGGLVFYGGFIAAFIAALIYIKKNNLLLWKTADILAPSVVLGQFFGRLGCFSAGCCYGKVCHLPWAVTFTDPKSLAPLHTSVHPTQLYSSVCDLMIFAALIFLRKRKKYHGYLFWMYVMLYGITRFVIEMFRGDFRGDDLLGVLSISQAIGGTLAVIAVVMLLKLSKKSKRSVP
jgi:phosphatidylglycerol:prolipoprotein diacylglycerol transferase